MKFTSSPYEAMMKEVPAGKPPEPTKAPENSRCHGCPYWKGIACVTCYRELLSTSVNGGRGVEI